MGGGYGPTGGPRSPAGLLYVEVECPPDLEAEFHAWYNTEHVPERLSIPGFVTGRRYAALEGMPRWLAVYELEDVAVLESHEYLAWIGPRQTAWTKRIVSSTRVHRSVFRLSRRANATLQPGETLALTGLLAVRYEALPANRTRLERWHDSEFSAELLALSGVSRVCRYENVEGDDQLVLYELEHPWVVQEAAFAHTWTRGWESKRESLSSFRRSLCIKIL